MFDIGSSFLPSEIIAAFLWAQLENIQDIQQKRKSHWEKYKLQLENWAASHQIQLPTIPEYATNNGHMFFIKCKNVEQRTTLINKLKAKDIHPVFHYISLHSSPYYSAKHDGRALPNTDNFTDTLLRLPLFYELDVQTVINQIIE